MKKLSDYISALQKVLDEHGDLNCFYARDDEGNGYQALGYDPTVMQTNDPDGHNAELYGADEEFDEDDNMTQVCCVN